MKGFIEVRNNRNIFVVNVDHIIYLQPRGDGTTVIELSAPEKSLIVNESYKEIIDLMIEVSCRP
jgi:uncharacterized protein YlzI (FlbEa/FlbD family)